MHVQMKYLRPVKISGFVDAGDDAAGMRAAWSRLAEWVSDAELQAQALKWIALRDGFSASGDRPAPSAYRLGVQLAKPLGVLPRGIEIIQVPGGVFAVHDYTGSFASVPDALSRLCRDVGPAHGLLFDPLRPCVERYDLAPGADDNAACDVELCVPVTPSQG